MIAHPLVKMIDTARPGGLEVDRAEKESSFDSQRASQYHLDKQNRTRPFSAKGSS